MSQAHGITGLDVMVAWPGDLMVADTVTLSGRGQVSQFKGPEPRGLTCISICDSAGIDPPSAPDPDMQASAKNFLAQGAVPLPDGEELFEAMFSAEALEALFKEKFSASTGKGTDRLNGFQFAGRAKSELQPAAVRCKEGSYHFAPYLEVLRTKGRDKLPRLIGIPTIRDRIVMSQLGRYLAAMFPERVPRNVASSYVRAIASDLHAKDKQSTWVCSTDIKTFYDDIRRERLVEVLAKRIKSKAALKLIRHALYTPITPKNCPRSRQADFRTKKGVPQGLAISNILASIYMQDVDEAMAKFGVTYYRYVDDVLMYGEEDIVRSAFKSLKGRLSLRGLRLHPLGSGKTTIRELSVQFGYLGYQFIGEHVTVRESTVEKLLHSLASKFSEFSHNKARRLQKFKYLNEERLKEIFMLELNERITGALKETRRYGWIAYFSQINDLTLLHRIDQTIAGLFARLPEFGRKAPDSLQKISRAYWEMKFNPHGGYIRDYDRIVTRAEKLDFLVQRGRINSNQAYTDDEINDRYNKYVHGIISSMHADEGVNYG